VTGLLLGLAAGTAPGQPALDICGCREHPDSLGAFDTTDEASWPPGTEARGNELVVPLPPDGVLVFDSVSLERWSSLSTHRVRLARNARNTPAYILVSGDFSLGERVELRVDGADGTDGRYEINGRGGEPGPGGFRGGDGAYQDVNGAADGGEGQGPGGGSAGLASEKSVGGNARFAGPSDLRPLVGGSGGGGGASLAEGNCSASGGGGGGGALLLAVNGTLTIDGTIDADGGHYGSHVSNGECATRGGEGSGGAVRVLAARVRGGGVIRARGGRGYRDAQPGVIRIESLTEDELPAHRIAPPAIRSQVVGPLVNPVATRVDITAVAGQPVPEALTGVSGGVDLVLPAPGEIKFQLRTEGVPAGTLVELAVKPRVGGAATRERTELNASACDPAGRCTAFVTLELASGAYFVEALATFETP
jgi:hypothetical protein